MKKETAELLADYSDGELEIREDYRGRSGFSGTAVAGDSGALMLALAAFVEDALEHDQEDCAAVAESLRNLRSDSMGLGMIWY